MNGKQRFQFAGEPRRCIKCNAPLKRNYYRHLGLTVVICPNYGKTYHASTPFGDYTGSGDLHEHYRFLDSDPGLPAILRPLPVGDMGAEARAAVWASIIFLVLAVGGALIASLFGG